MSSYGNPKNTENQKNTPFGGTRASVLLIGKNAAYGLGGSGVAILLRLAISLVVIRSLGASSFGIYVLCLALLGFSEIVTLFGMEDAVVKFVSQFKAVNDIARLRGTIYWATGMILVLSLTICGSLLYSSYYLAHHVFNKPHLVPVLKVMALSLPLSTVSRILLASLQGYKLIKYKVFVREMLVPFARLLCVVLTIAMGYKIIGVAWSFVFSHVAGILGSSCFLIRHIPEVTARIPMVFERRKIINFSLPLLFSRMLNKILGRIDILMAGLFLPATMVGIYGVTKRLIPLIIVALGAFNAIFAPIISDLFTLKKLDELAGQFKTVAKWIFMVSLPIFALLTVFSREILAVFGPDFVAGSNAMIILALGQIINAATGSSGFLLMMTGRPHVNLVNSALLCATNIVLNFYLIPRYGIIGAACASAVSIAAIQLLRLAEIWYFLRIHPYRWDFWKPTVSCSISILIISASARLGMNPNHMLNMAMLVLLFIATYMVLLYLFKLSPEDRIVLQALKHKLAPAKH